MEKISVIMSAYNESERDLSLSIESILLQTYTNLEIIIINDNPQNLELESVLNSISDSRVHVIKNSQNIGLVNSLNKAIAISTGDYIARMDADDISIIDRIEKQVNYLKSNNYDLIGGMIRKIDENGSFISNEVRFQFQYEKIKKIIRYGNQFAHPTFLGKREVFVELGYRQIPYCEDYDFIIRAIEKGMIIGNYPEVCLYYRIRDNGISESHLSIQMLNSEYIAKGKMEIILKQDFVNNVFTKEYLKALNNINRYTKFKKKHSLTKCLIVFNKYFWYKVYKKIRIMFS